MNLWLYSVAHTIVDLIQARTSRKQSILQPEIGSKNWKVSLFVNALREVSNLTTNTFWTILKAVIFVVISESSRFKNDPNLKHLKNWVINNGLYTDTAV